jgi:hypothetical protein
MRLIWVKFYNNIYLRKCFVDKVINCKDINVKNFLIIRACQIRLDELYGLINNLKNNPSELCIKRNY